MSGCLSINKWLHHVNRIVSTRGVYDKPFTSNGELLCMKKTTTVPVAYLGFCEGAGEREPKTRGSRRGGTVTVWPWLGSPLTALRRVMYFRFYVMFSYHGTNGPTASDKIRLQGRLNKFDYAEAANNKWRQTTKPTVFGRVHHNTVPGAKSAIYDWLVVVSLFCCSCSWSYSLCAFVSMPHTKTSSGSSLCGSITKGHFFHELHKNTIYGFLLRPREGCVCEVLWWVCLSVCLLV